ncbi:MAG: glycosyltransferase [Candidatus Bathyarchaeota archaeon]|nr:glycosyltransferase [Candidatus Bathyarchaeota archaeon]
MIIIAWFILVTVFIGVPSLYFLQMKRQSAKPWKLKIDENYRPSVAILVPLHNEEKTIRLKLQNLNRVEYPAEKIETVLVNDASTDNTLAEISHYLTNNPFSKIKVYDSKEHLGKTECLNRALKSVNADVIIISDADCFWPSDILLKALPYLSDPTVGAVTARELLLNPHGSWVTMGEQFYDNTVQSWRIGESKTHSTIFFQGGFAAYKHHIINEFDREADDSGTALNIVQKNNRALLIPEIGFYTTFPAVWRNKVTLKVRRARQLQRLWAKCFMLLTRGKLVIPKKIAIPEIFLHLVNPLLLVVLGLVSIVMFVEYPIFLLAFLIALCPTLLVRKTRTIILEILQNNFILLVALASFVTSKRINQWKTVQESRVLLTEDILREKQLL